MKTSIPLFIIPTCLTALLAPSIVSAQILVDDTWADEELTKTGDPEKKDTDWWCSNHPNRNAFEITASEAGMGMVTGTSGRGLHATFAPQTLAVGDTLTATFHFLTPATVGTDRGAAFKFSMMDGSDPAVAADLLSSSSAGPNPAYIDLAGYMIDFDVNKPIPDDEVENMTFRTHDTQSTPDVNTTGRGMGTTGEWTTMGSSNNDPLEVTGYKFTANTEYTVVMAVSKTGANTTVITGSLSQGETLLASHSVVDEDQFDDLGALETPSYNANNFGMIGVWVNSNTFGSSSSRGVEDNGITFSNVTVARDPVLKVVIPITHFAYDKSAKSVTIDFPAVIGTGYLLFGSDDLEEWEELDDITADVVEGNFTLTGVTTTHQYYRIEGIEE